MRIGIFTDTYAPTVNGISVVAVTTKKELEALGHEVFIFAPGEGLRGMRKMQDGVYRLPSFSGKHLLYDEALISIYIAPSELRRIKALQLDVVHTLTPNIVGMLGAQAARKFNIPLVQHYCTDLAQYAYHYPKALPFVIAAAVSAPFIKKTDRADLIELAKGLTPDLPNKWAKKLTSKLIPIVYNQSDHVVAVSRKVAKSLQEVGVTKPISIIPTGIDPLPVDLALVNDLRNEYSLDKEDHVILSLGRLSKEKNLELLLQMFDIVRKQDARAKLLFVGDFDYRMTLERIASKSPYESDIIFAGKHPHDELGNYYALADVFVFPSVTDTQGLVVHEAAGAELPIIMVDREVTEVVKEGVNGLFAENEPESFAECVLAVLTDDALRLRYSRASAKEACAFTERKQTQALVSIYEDIIGQR